MPPGNRIRPMHADDVESIAAIESRSYEFPWTPGIFRDCLRVGYTCHVLIGAGGDLEGYCIMAIAAEEAHILNLCIAPEARGRGLGGYLLLHLLEVASEAKCGRLFLEVRPSNEAALRLYRAHGFEQIGIRRDYYRASGGREDAVVLARALA